MLPKHYNNSTLLTPLRLQTVATRLITSATKKVNMADETHKIEQPLLESSSEMDKLVHEQYQTFPRDPNYRVGDKLSCSRLLSDGEMQLTEPSSAKMSVVEAQKCYTLFPRNMVENFLEKSVQKIFEHL